MRILMFLSLIFLVGCSSLIYDNEKLFIHSDVDLNSINVILNQRKYDSQMFVQISGVPLSNQSVYYKIDWFDINGIKITTVLSQWKRANLIKNVDFTWKLPAPTKSAVSYKIYITKNIGNGIIQ